MTDTPDRVGRGGALGPDDGEALWHLGDLLTLKATGERTEGRFALMEERGGAGYASPLHADAVATVFRLAFRPGRYQHPL